MKLFSDSKNLRDRLIFVGADFFLSLIGTIGMQIHFVGSVWGSPEENYVESFDFTTILHFLMLFIVNGIILLLFLSINILYNQCKIKRQRHLVSRIVTDNKKLFYITSISAILVAWLPYLLAYFPGGIYVDTFSSIGSAFDMDSYGLTLLNNHHPILYTLLWRGVILLGRLFQQDFFFSAALFQIIQYIFMAAILAYLIFWIKNKGLKKEIVLALQILVMFFPLFPLYAISIWKDTIFSLVLLLFILCVADIVLDKKRICLKDTGYLLKFFTLGFFVAFTRNNGKYIVFLTIAVLLAAKIRKIFKYKKMALLFLSLILSISVIQGPIYDKMNYNMDTATESLGIPLQQLCYLVYYDYDLTEDELNYINTIVSTASIKKNYTPCIFDSVKWYAPDFRDDSIQQSPARFFYYYTKIVLKHPIGAIKAYMLATAGFWAPNVSSIDGYAQTWMWENQYHLKSIDYLEKYFGVTIRSFINDLKPVSSAVFLLFIFATALVLIINQDYRKLVILLPAAANWLTVMVATPIANSLRYVYILVLILPLEIMLICTSTKTVKSDITGSDENG